MANSAEHDYSENDIAIVGMAGRFPGARGVDALWRLVREGIPAISRRTEDELLAAGASPEMLADPNYVRASGLLEDVESFDAGFFDIGPRDAAIMDPQHRHFLECAWEALEHAGHVPESFQGSIGVYAGCGMNGYMLHNLLTNPEMANSVGMFLLRHTANDKDFLSTGVSYRLNLRGPSVNVQTACSTSLVAIHLAAQALLGGECDMALAGGVTIEVPHGAGYLYREGEVLSPDGYCRAFDAGSHGTVLASGVGVVALRRLRDAIADRDTIHAVIKASAINNDGSGKVGYLAPSVDGHAGVVAEALAIADIPADSIQYLEAHGTGTAVGDPIEIAALTQAYRTSTDRTGFCRVGSTKPNIGHLDTAAGVASVIKTALALEHRELPPLANFTSPNPLIDFAHSPFYVSTEVAPWETDSGPRRAGVSSLGVGGTNAHVILQEAPPPAESGPARPWQLIALSARSEAALDRVSANLAVWLREHPEASLADAAWTLQVGRGRFPHRRVLAARDGAEAAALLETPDPKRVFSAQDKGDEPSVVFMFPGGGAQYPDMGRELYETEPVYRQEIDRCFALLDPDLSERVRALLFPAPEDKDAAAARLEMTSVQLPAIFMTEYALAKLWMSWGMQPAAMTGHSLGEYTAACLAGVFSLKDALEIVALRGRLVESIPDAAMLSVPLPEGELRGLLPDNLSLASVNGPELCVVSGNTAAIAAFEQTLTEKGLESRRLKIVAAAHSYLLDPVLEEFGARLARVRMNAPKMPYVSNVTGTWVRPEDAQNPQYWVRHLRHTVRFADGLAELLSDLNRILIEVGPGNTLTSLSRQQPVRPRGAVTSLPHPQEPVTAGQHLVTTVGRAWMAGLRVDWAAFHGSAPRRRLPLPVYPFERTRYWIEPGKGAHAASAGGLERAADLADWFYRPVWKRSDLVTETAPAAGSRWLVFMDNQGVGADLVARLRAAGQEVLTAERGAAFTRHGPTAFTLNPESRADHERLITEATSGGHALHQIVHLWSLIPARAGLPATERAAHAQRHGFSSLLALAQALGGQEPREPLRLTVVTAGAQQVDGEPLTNPAAATVLGPVRVIPREIQNVTCRVIDIDAPVPTPRRLPLPFRALRGEPKGFPQTFNQGRGVRLAPLFAELCSSAPDTIVALRAGRRWVQDYDHVPLPEVAPPSPPMLGGIGDSAAPSGPEAGARTSSPQNWGAGGGLRPGGVYLITGGLGGIGLALAGYLAREYKAKLALLGRTPMPPSADWDTWLASHEDDDPISRRIRALMAIAESGGEALPVHGDVCSVSDMERVRQEMLGRFGAVHGVFHAAGVLDDGLIQLKMPESAAAVLAPKVTGTLVLDQVFGGAPLDLMVLFSSSSSLLGLEGQVDYTAANAFLNAFAHAKRAAGGPYVVAVDWGVWREVGLASDLVHGRPRLSGSPQPVVHPLLGTATVDATGRLLCEATYRVDGLWALDEHRVQSGVALIPGTGYLEIGRAAAARLGLPGTLELRDIFFIAPLEVADAERRAVRVSLTPTGDAYDFAVSSNPAGATATAGWHDHAVGEARLVQASRPQPLDVAAIEARCPRDVVTFGPGEQMTRQERSLRFGPRWKNLRRMSYGDGEAVARLELLAPYHGDLEQYPLHPALLDLATSFALPLVEGYAASDDFFVPMSYRRVRVFAPLTPRIVSHARLRGATDAHAEVVAFDVTIMDEAGNVLVEVEEFSLRRVSSTDAFVRPAAAMAVHADAPSFHHSAADTRRPAPLGFHLGIGVDEGMEALSRILAVGRLPEVAVSPVELAALRREAGAVRKQADETAIKVSRPELGSAYAGPRDEVETMLVVAWEDLLGLEQVGINDDFFDLGGHSLIAVRLLTRVKKAYGMQLALATLFDAPTIAGLAAVIRAELGIELSAGAEGEGAPPLETAGATERWSSLVPIQRNGSRRPIFCIHGMNGNVLLFHRLTKHLGDDQPFYGLQPVGLNGIDEPHSRVEDMAAHYVAEMQRVQSHGPYLLAGYSGGGLIAFEMMRQLQTVGEEVALLALIDTYCPTFMVKSGTDKVRYFLKGLRTEGPGFARRWAWTKGKRLLNRAGLLRSRADEPPPWILYEVDDESQTVDLGSHFVDAQNRYQMRPLDGQAVMFRAMERSEAGYVPPDLGWGRYLTGGVTVMEVTGGHHTMFTEPHVGELAAHLRSVLLSLDSSYAVLAS